MARNCLKIIWLPCDLKSKVKRLARLNNISCSELIRLSIEAKLPDYEAGPLVQAKSGAKQPKLCTALMKPLRHRPGGSDIP